MNLQTVELTPQKGNNEILITESSEKAINQYVEQTVDYQVFLTPSIDPVQYCHEEQDHKDQEKQEKPKSFNPVRIIVICITAAVILAVLFTLIGLTLRKLGILPDPNQQIFDIVRLNSKSALCLDGSPAAYHVSRTGNRSKILIYFQGGAWCGAPSDDLTLQSCYGRSKMGLGSSTFLKQTIAENQGILSSEPDNYFKDWTRVYFHYCDGSGHQGTKKQPVLYNNRMIYFRGYNITTERFEDLEKRFGLFTKAQKVAIVGESAGGLATVMWTNYLADKVKKGKIWSIPDAGLFLDSVNVITNTSLHKNNFANLMKLTNVEIDPPVPDCVARFPNSKENCMLAQNLYQDIKVPMFVSQSLYDAYELIDVIGTNCVIESIRNCSFESRRKIESNRESMVKLLKEVASSPGNGAYGISCMNHMMLTGSQFSSKDYKVGGYTLSKAITEWIENSSDYHTHLDEVSWPNNGPCSGEDNQSQPW